MADQNTDVDQDNIIPPTDEGESSTPKKEGDTAKEQDNVDSQDDNQGEQDGGESQAPDSKDEDIEEDKIPVRSTAAHIIARKNQTIEKLRSKIDQADVDLQDEDDDTLSPEAERAVGRMVKKAIEPFVNTVIGNTDESELQGLFSNEPEAKKYEKRIRAYMKHPAYQAVPPSAIFHHLAFQDIASVKNSERSRKKEMADKEADQYKGGGNNRRISASRSSKTMPTVAEMEQMSDEEIETMGNDIQTGKYRIS